VKSCNSAGQRALAQRDAPAIGQRVRPTSALGKRRFFRSGTRRPMSSAQELCLALAKAPWPPVGRPRCKSLPPTRPAAWPSFWGRVGGAVSRAQHRRPTCFGNDRGGWVGIPPELPQWRPMCFGSHATSNNRATSTAMGLFQVAPGLCKRALAAAPFAQELAVPVPTHVGCSCDARGQRPPTPVGAGAPWPRVQHPRLVSPTHPPCGLALLYGGG
jgi:hypothetical protein